MPHCAGRKSIARIRAEKTFNGVEPSRAIIYMETRKDRKTKDKKKIDEESARAVEMMKTKIAKLPDGVEQSQGSIAWPGDIYDQLINKPERCVKVRGVGFGVLPSSLWDKPSFSQSSINRSICAFSTYHVRNDQMEKIIEERMKVMQENHKQELNETKKKTDNDMKDMFERQVLLEKNLSTLVTLLKDKFFRRKIYPH